MTTSWERGRPARAPRSPINNSSIRLLLFIHVHSWFVVPLGVPSPFFVALRGYLFAFSWKSFLPFPTLGGSLSSLLQPLSGPSVLRGPSWNPSPFSPARGGTSPTPSWPFAVLRGPSWISFCLFLEIFSPCPTIGGSLSSLLQPLRGPSPFFVALRGYLFAFSWKSFPLARPLADPSQAFSNPLVALRGPSCPFVDNSFPLPSQICPTPN